MFLKDLKVWLGIARLYSQCGDSPLDLGELGRRLHEVNADQEDGGYDGHRPHEPQQEADQARYADQEVDGAG